MRRFLFGVSIVMIAVGVTIGTILSAQPPDAKVTGTYTVQKPPPRPIPDSSPNNEYKKNYNFNNDWFTYNVVSWKKYLGKYTNKPTKYLEIGSFEGRSLIWSLENTLSHPESTATVIDPFLPEAFWNMTFKDRWDTNLELSGHKAKVNLIQGYSQIELRKLPLDTYDIIYIDGSHTPADCLEDLILSFRLLKVGGFLIADDYAMQSTKDNTPKPGIDAFWLLWHDKLEYIYTDWQIIFRKKAD